MPFPTRRLASRFSCPVPVSSPPKSMGSEPSLHHRLAHIHRYRYCLSAPLARSSRRSLRLPRTPYVRLIAYSSAIAYCLLPIVSAPLACICRRLIPGFWFSHIIRSPSHHRTILHTLNVSLTCLVFSASPPTVSLLLCFASSCRALLLFAGIMKRMIKGRVFISVWRVCVCVLRNSGRAHGAPTRMH